MVYSTMPYTIPLRDAWRVPRTQRSKYCINIIRKFITRHSIYIPPGTNKTIHVSNVLIDQDVNEHIWSRGRENPPRKVRVKAVIIEPSDEDEEPLVEVSLFEEEGVHSGATAREEDLEPEIDDDLDIVEDEPVVAEDDIPEVEDTTDEPETDTAEVPADEKPAEE